MGQGGLRAGTASWMCGDSTPETWLWRHRRGMRAGVTLGYHRPGAVGQEVRRGGISEAIAGITCSVLVAILKTEIGKLGKELQEWLQTWDCALERLSLKVAFVYQLCRWVSSETGAMVFK